MTGNACRATTSVLFDIGNESRRKGRSQRHQGQQQGEDQIQSQTRCHSVRVARGSAYRVLRIMRRNAC